MASEAEIERVRKDKGLWLPLVQRLHRHVEDETLNPRHIGFVESLIARPKQEELSFRQSEWLLDARDEIVLISEYGGHSVSFMSRACYESRIGLDGDDDQDWVVELFKSGRTSIRRYEARRLYVLARQLGEIEYD